MECIFLNNCPSEACRTSRTWPWGFLPPCSGLLLPREVSRVHSGSSQYLNMTQRAPSLIPYNNRYSIHSMLLIGQWTESCDREHESWATAQEPLAGRLYLPIYHRRCSQSDIASYREYPGFGKTISPCLFIHIYNSTYLRSLVPIGTSR